MFSAYRAKPQYRYACQLKIGECFRRVEADPEIETYQVMGIRTRYVHNGCKEIPKGIFILVRNRDTEKPIEIGLDDPHEIVVYSPRGDDNEVLM